MPGLPIVFFILAAIAVITALGTIFSRNALYSALLLVLNFATIAVLYLILGAPFIALSQITVYAGSIMVLFLFVIMLLGAEHLPQSESLPWQPIIAIPLAVIMVGVLGYNLFQNIGKIVEVASVPANFGDPAAVGQLLFTQYQLPFEITAVILLSAVIGAVMLAKPDRPSQRPKPGQYARQVTASTPAVGQSAAAREVPVEKQEEEALKTKVEG